MTIVILAVAATAGCQASGRPGAARTSINASATASPRASSGNDACAKIVSAIGFAEFLLQPRGEEDKQNFEDAVIGRLAYVQGVVAEYGNAVPSELRDPVTVVDRATKELSVSDVPRARQVALLKEYRGGAQRVMTGCRKQA